MVRGLAAALVLLFLVAIFAAPWMNVSRFRRRIALSISEGIGRPVQIGAVSFRLFPQPAFVLSDVSVAEDPAFGAEPVMTAATVTATLRISSLWHARFEVATLSLEDPSLNLAHNPAGQWDFDSVLRRTATPRMSGMNPSSRTERFPYVEASGARINFKFGNEKQPFSLMDADLALWKESSGPWHLRLKAQPVRTDLDLTDTGELRAEAVLRYAPSSDQRPITAHAEWSKAPLGEISRLLLGHDTGWRGTVNMVADVTGNLAAVDLATDTRVKGFRRAEFVPTDNMDGEMQCGAHYERATAQLSSIVCNAPLDSGTLHLAGSLFLHPQPAGSVQSNLQATFRSVPAEFILNLLRHVHRGISTQISANGTLNGQLDCEWVSNNAGNPCAGAFHAAPWTLTLPGVTRPLAFSSLDIARTAHPAPAANPMEKFLRGLRFGSKKKPSSSGFVLAPVSVALGASPPATITGTLAPQGYVVTIAGPTTLDFLMPMTRALGWSAFPTMVRSAQGDALLTLALQGAWLPAPIVAEATVSAPPAWKATLQLQKTKMALADWPGKLLLSTATLHLMPGVVLWQNIRGSYQKENFDGGLQYVTSTVTNSSSPCEFHFHVENLNPERLQMEILAQSSPSSRLLDMVQRWMGNMPSLPACTGKILSDHLSVGALTVNHAALALQIDGQKATASSISGNVLGGALQGRGSVDWATGTPTYQGQFALHNLQPNAVAVLLQSPAWGHGSVDVHLNLTTQGFTAHSFMERAAGNFTAQWKSGGWNAPALTATPLASFQRCSLRGTIRNQTLQIASGVLLAPPLHAFVTGTVAFSGEIHLHLQPSELQIQGTLAHPTVSEHSQKPSGKAAQ